MNNLFENHFSPKELMKQHHEHAKIAADYMVQMREAELAGNNGSVYDYSFEAGENFYLSGLCLETIGHHHQAMISYRLSSKNFLIAADSSENDLFWNATCGYRESTNSFRRVEDAVARHTHKPHIQNH